MRSARFALVVMTVGALTLAGVLSAQQPKPAKPMQIEKVKDGLFVIRGPFNPCAPNGCGGAYGDDGLLHEAGDVAVRVTSEGLILVDDKFQNNVSEILEHVKSVSALPVKYLAEYPSPHRSRRRRCGLHQHDGDHRAPERPRELSSEQAAGRTARHVQRPGVGVPGRRRGARVLLRPRAHQR